VDNNKFIFLPGSVFQVNKFIEDNFVEGKDIIIIGANSEAIAEEFLAHKAKTVIIVVDDNDTLIRSRFILSGRKNISVRMMEYTNTDYNDASFDIVYAQASISTKARKKILKEINTIVLQQQNDFIATYYDILSELGSHNIFIKNEKQLNITQEELANKLHVKQSAISKMEKREGISLANLQKMIKAMGGEIEINIKFPNKDKNFKLNPSLSN